ncbi:MAG TPA: GNAT family N-acetyltransferase [Pseudomonadales bacterium]
MHEVSIRCFRREEWPVYRALRLRALADAPDAFGSTYAAARQRPDSAWAQRLDHDPNVDLPLTAEVGDTLGGLAWGHIDPADPATVHLYQMWVAPEHRGRGIGAALLARVVDWARERGARRVALAVTCGNSPARRLYERAGFRPVGQPEPLRPGSDLRVQPMERTVDTASPSPPSR